VNIFPVPLPSSLFQPLANHWLPANGGRVIISECEGEDYLCLEGECRLVHRLPEEKRGQQYGLLFNLLSLVREPVQWQDLSAIVPPDGLLTWCERYGLLLPMEIMPDGGEGALLQMAQVEVVTLYLTYRLWESILLPLDQPRDVLRREQEERSPLIRLLSRRYLGRRGIELGSPAYLLREAAWTDSPAHQFKLLKAAIDDTVSQRFTGLTPRLSLLHEPPQLVMQAQSPLHVAYWQFASLALQPSDNRRYHVCPCGRRFYGHANRKWCAQCDRRTAHSRRVRGRRFSGV
jgi:hypothetical protein